MRSLLLLALALGACGQSTDDRPLTNAVVTAQVLAPLCGKTECHSTFVAEQGFVLDTTHGVTTTLRYQLEHVDDSQLFLPVNNPGAQPLQSILNVRGDVFSQSADQQTPMPLDSPMLDQDAAYLVEWLAEGAPGACDPSLPSFCNHITSQRVTCGADNEYVYTPDSSCN